MIGCFEKHIMVDYKSKCKTEDQKEVCESFVSCCNDAAYGNCTSYFSGELERPLCILIKKWPFDYAMATCRCVTDTSVVALRNNNSVAGQIEESTTTVLTISISGADNISGGRITRAVFAATVLVVRGIWN